MRARVLIRPKAGILDPQGGAGERGLPARGFEGVETVHVGRLVELDVAAEDQLQPLCEKLLANPLVEDYEIEVLGSWRASGGCSSPAPAMSSTPWRADGSSP